MRFVLIAMCSLAACHEPLFPDTVPRPNKAAAAAVTAGAAAALTIADPVAAQRQQEERKVVPEPKLQKVQATVPEDVLDRLDASQDPPSAPER